MISLKDVSKWYGQFQVLTDCSTEVKKGKLLLSVDLQDQVNRRLSKPLMV